LREVVVESEAGVDFIKQFWPKLTEKKFW
jgi:hypothetical protein